MYLSTYKDEAKGVAPLQSIEKRGFIFLGGNKREFRAGRLHAVVDSTNCVLYRWRSNYSASV